MAQDPNWPLFLDLLDSNPDAAFAEFYKYAGIVLTARPPRPLLGLSPEDRQDCFQDIVLHCVKDDFGVLRHYVDMGRPFSAWLYVIAHNMALDFIEKLNRRRGIEIQPTERSDGPVPEPEPLATSGNPGDKEDLNGLIEKVEELIGQLGDECRELLKLAAFGLKPREMAEVLGLPTDENKRVSDHLGYCRDKLKKRLAQEGYDLKAYLM